MKNCILTLCLVSISLFFGCSSDEVTPSTSILDFVNIEVGNYWIYEWYEIEPDGTTSSFNTRDSLIIVGDTLISGKRFFIRSGTLLGGDRTELLLFDSLNSIFTYPAKEMLFTLDDTIEETKNYGPKEDPVASGKYSLSDEVSSITVPAGEFECLNYQGLIEPLQQDYEYGTRINSNLYSHGVGLVLMKTQFYSSPNDLEMRLVSFGKIQ